MLKLVTERQTHGLMFSPVIEHRCCHITFILWHAILELGMWKINFTALTYRIEI